MITDISTTGIVETDLRDSGGRKLRILQITSFTGTYESGGIVIDPEWFHMREINALIAQSTTAIPLSGAGEPWSLVSNTTIAKIDSGAANGTDLTGVTEWRMIVHINTGSSFDELSDGSPLQFPDGFYPTLIVVGKPI